MYFRRGEKSQEAAAFVIGIVAVSSIVLRRAGLFVNVDYLAVFAKGMGNKSEMEDKLGLPG